jgi:hypothetical protein
MKKHILLLITLLFTYQCSAFAEEKAPTFKNLHDALIFIDSALDKDDWKILEQALYPEYKEGEPNRTAFSQLKEARGKRRLTEIYEDRDFDQKMDKFEIGNCGVAVNDKKGLSHTWITFIKSEDGWKLNRVWGCR